MVGFRQSGTLFQIILHVGYETVEIPLLFQGLVLTIWSCNSLGEYLYIGPLLTLDFTWGLSLWTEGIYGLHRIFIQRIGSL